MFGTWFIGMTPWFIRNYMVFGDPLWTTGIPINKKWLVELGLINFDAPYIEIGKKGFENGDGKINRG